MRRRSQDWAILKRMVRQARSHWPHLAGIFVLGLLAAPLALLLPLPLKIVIDNVLGNRPLPPLLANLLPLAWQRSGSTLLIFSALLLIGITALTQLQGLASSLLQTWAGEGMVLDFRAQLFRHTQRLSLAFHDARGAADSTFRIQYDAPSIQYITINGVIPLFSAVLTLAGMIWVTAHLDWQLAWIALAISPVLFGLTRAFSGRLRERWKDVKRLESSTNSIVHEALSSMRVVKAFGREEHEQHRFHARATHRLREMLQVSLLQGGFDLLVGITIACGTAATLLVGAWHVRAGSLSLGDLMLVTAYLAQLYEPLRTISKKLGDLQSGLASAERAFALLDELPEVVERPNARRIARSRGAVDFENVSFAYDGLHPVLSEVSFQAPPGTRVGIQGRTGAGKSTLMSLLARFYDPTGGRILVDGVDLRDFKLADLRNQFGIVLQDSVLFSTTIAENIAYGRPAADEQDIVKAARLANAHDFIQALPDGYNTLVGERGMRLSGGERQRIALARAFLKDAPILILDEPTSSVDVRTETAILEALERLMQGRTTFMIAHRLSTLDHCDLRLEIRNGRLVTLREVATGV